MNKESDISLRITQIRDEFFNGNQSAFAREVGISESSIRSYLTGTIPKADALEKIATSIAISCEWFLTGKGDMRRTQAVAPQAAPRDTDKKEIERLTKLLDEKEKELTKYKKQVDDLRKRPYQVPETTSAAAEPPIQYGNGAREQGLLDIIKEQSYTIRKQADTIATLSGDMGKDTGVYIPGVRPPGVR